MRPKNSRFKLHHILWECPFAQNVWALFRGRTQKCSNKASDFFILFRQMQGKLNQQELEKWAVTAWATWTARNKFYFQHYQTHPKVIAGMACGLLEEYQRFIDTQGQNQSSLLFTILSYVISYNILQPTHIRAPPWSVL